MFKLIINCGPCQDYIQKCLDSVMSQTIKDWEAFVTIDPCGDMTYERALDAAGSEDRIFITQNAGRLYSMANLVYGIERSHALPEDVIVVLDGDDWFHVDNALEIIANTYKTHDCWITYGSWISNKPDSISHRQWPAYETGENDFRNKRWLATAVRTWKKWLWELVDDSDLRDEQGDYFRVAEDLAAVFPMLEMSGTARARHIPDVLMVYNRANPHCVGDTMWMELRKNDAYIRSKPPYLRLKEKPSGKTPRR